MKHWLSEFLLAFGGSAVVLGALFTWIGKRYLDKLSEAERARNAAKIEAQRGQFATDLEKIKKDFAKEMALFSVTIEPGP